MKEKTGRDRIIQLFDDLDAAKLLATTKYRAACNNCKSIQDEALAARDKWWIDRLNEEHIVIRLTDDQDEFTPGDYIAIPLERWKNLKKESGS